MNNTFEQILENKTIIDVVSIINAIINTSNNNLKLENVTEEYSSRFLRRDFSEDTGKKLKVVYRTKDINETEKSPVVRDSEILFVDTDNIAYLYLDELKGFITFNVRD